MARRAGCGRGVDFEGGPNRRCNVIFNSMHIHVNKSECARAPRLIARPNLTISEEAALPSSRPRRCCCIVANTRRRRQTALYLSAIISGQGVSTIARIPARADEDPYGGEFEEEWT